MNSLSLNTSTTFSTYLSLRQKIRNAEEPDNPGLIRQFLDLPPTTNQNTKAVYCAHLLAQFQLLLDTLADECLPPHWRCQCLDHIYIPLFSLQCMAECKQSKRQVLSLIHELRVTSHYLQPGLLA